MSEDTEVVRLRVVNTSVSETISKTYQCRVTLTFEAHDRIVAEKVLKRFNGMEMTLESTLHEEALDVVKKDLEDLHKTGELKERNHRAEVEMLQQTISLQERELRRLRDIEEQLRVVAQFSVNPSGAVVR